MKASLLTLYIALFVILGLRETQAGLTPEAVDALLESNASITWTNTGEWSEVPATAALSPTASALRAPLIRNGESHTLAGEVFGPGVLRGWVRASSEKGQDRLEVSIGGMTLAEFSGEETREFVLPVPRGQHVLGFKWSKDASRTAGADTVWLDRVRVEGNAEVPPPEALDLAGTPHGGRLVFSEIDGWRGITDAAARNGGDALFAPVGSRTLKVTATQPSVVSFWSHSPADGQVFGFVMVEGAGGASVLSSEVQGLWTKWRAVLPAGASLTVKTLGSTADPESVVGEGQLLDDWTVEPLNTANWDAAVDSAVGFVPSVLSLNAATLPNGSFAAFAGSGPLGQSLTRDGVDAVMSQPLVPAGNVSAWDASAQLALTTTVTGPGRLSFWWRREGTGLDDHSPQAAVLPPGEADGMVQHLQSPVAHEWREVVVSVPPGNRTVQLRWTARLDTTLFVDQVNWLATPRAVPSPSVADAADVSGLDVTNAGNWQPAGWSGAGVADDDVLLWMPGESPQPFTATCTGPGWLTFSIRLVNGGVFRLTMDGTPEELSPLRVHSSDWENIQRWQHFTRWLPAGAHTVVIAPPGAADVEEVYLDSLTFSATPPSWVGALEGTGMAGFQMAAAPSVVDTAVTHDGTDALRLPDPGAGKYALFAALAPGPGTLSWWWRQADPQPLSITPNTAGTYGPGASLMISGNTDWQQGQSWVSWRDTHQWLWSRSARPSLPGDAFWLDEMTFTPVPVVTLGQALGSPELNWTSQGAFTPVGGFPGFPETAHVVLARDSGYPPQPAWLETVLNGPGILQLKAQGFGYGFPGSVLINGVPVALTPRGANSYRSELVLPGAGAKTCRVNFSNQNSSVEVRFITFTPQALTSPAAALDVAAATAFQTSGSVAGLVDAAVARDGVDAVRLESTREDQDEARLLLPLDVPAEITFWWRGEGEGSAQATDYTSTGDRASVALSGTTPWKFERVILDSRKEREFRIIVDTEGAAPYRVWMDQMTITPQTEVTLAEALGVPANTITTSGAWRGLRAPGAGGVAYAVPRSSQAAGVNEAWLEVRVTGPAVARFSMPLISTSYLPYSLSLTPAAGGAAVSLLAGFPVTIPAGEHLLRWTARGWASYPYPVEPPFDIAGFTLAPPDFAAALNTPGWTWTAPSGAWYPAEPLSTDYGYFSDQSILSTNGGAFLETTLTGPGWLQFEPGVSARSTNVFDPSFNTKLELRLLPPVTPDPLPPPVFTKQRNIFNWWDQRAPEVWVPPGTWRARFEADGPAALNNVRFTPGLTNAQIAAALDLPAGLTATGDSTHAGPISSSVTHDGTDALEVVAGSNTITNEGITFSFTGPAVLSGWIRYGNANTPLLHARLNGQYFQMPAGLPVAAGSDWRPFRLPVAQSGPVTVGLALSVGGQVSSVPALGLDEFTHTPLTPVPLAQALDTPGLTWTTSSDSWTGWASAIASPDAIDAAWCLDTAGTDPPPPLWMETTVTGPGALRFWKYGTPLPIVTVSGGGRQPDQVNYGGSYGSSTWEEWVFYIPPGEQTVRIATAYGLTGVDNVRWEPGDTTTLQAALDLPAGATVTTTGGNWMPTTIGAFSHDSADAVMLRTPFTNPSTLEVSVTGPAMASWWSRRDYSVEIDVQLDGQPLRAASGGGGGGVIIGARNVPAPAAPPQAAGLWYKEEIFVPAGTHWLRWTVRSGESGWYIGPDGEPIPLPASETAVLLGLDELTITPLPASGISFAEAIDQPGWEVSTNRPDKVRALPVPGMSFDAADVVLIAGSSEGDQPSLRTRVSGPGLLYYRWRYAGFSTGQASVRLDGQSPSVADAFQDDGSAWGHHWLLIPPGGPHEITWTTTGDEGHGILLDTVTFNPTIPLGTATGAPALTWTTGGDVPWVGVPFQPNPSSMAFAPHVLPGQSSWIETTVTGPGRLSWDAQGAHAVSYDGRVFQSALNYDLSRATLIVPAGIHRVRWSSRFDQSVNENNDLASVEWTPSAAPDPVAEALDAPQLPWFFEGTGDPWQPQAAPAMDGVDSLHWNQSGGSAWAISTVVPGPGTALIRAQSSGGFSEMLMGKPYDGDWRVLAMPVQTGGPQVFTFQIYGNTGYSTGPNRVDIDRFEWTPAAVTLAEGIDAPGAWTTSPDKPWTGVAVPSSYDGVDAVMAVSAAAGAWLETTITGPVRVQFFARGTGGFFKVDNGPRIPGDNPNEWRPFIMEVPAGSHTLHWESTGGEYTVDQFSVTPLTSSLAEALDHPGPWLVADAGQWTVSTSDTSDDSDAAVLSGQVGSNTLVLPVTGPGRLEFMVRAPFSANYADAEHELLVAGGTTLLTSNFTGDWQSLGTAHIPPGVQQLQFSLPGGYATKPATGFDQVRFTPYAEVPLAQALEGTGGVTFATSPASPWKGYAAAAGACDGIDAAAVTGDNGTWLNITVPAGAGELSFYAMRTRNSADLLIDSAVLPVLTHWKRLSLPITEGSPRTLRLSFAAGSLWLDQVAFRPSTAALQSWLAQHGLPPDTDLNSDNDHDGKPLLMEWAFGQNPLHNGVSDSGIPPEANEPVFGLVPRPAGNPDVLTLACRYARRTGVPGLIYHVEFSTVTDAAWQASSWATVEEWSNDWEIVTAHYPGDYYSTAPQVFGRLRVSWFP